MSKFYKILLFLVLNYFFLSSQILGAKEKIKIGLLVPMTGSNKEIGQSIIKAVILAVSDIDNDLIEIIVKDTSSEPNKTLKSAIELKEMGVQVVVGPVFHQSLASLDQIKGIKFLSLTNKTIDLPKNTIGAGVNSTSQLLAIKKFLDLNNIKKTIFLTPRLNYEVEIKKGIEESNIIIFKSLNPADAAYGLILSLIKSTPVLSLAFTYNKSHGILLDNNLANVVFPQPGDP